MIGALKIEGQQPKRVKVVLHSISAILAMKMESWCIWLMG